MSLFGSLEIGKSGINASKSGQYTTGHNISNVDTPGYTRQQIKQSADTTRFEGVQNGVSVDGVRRLHDEFTNKKIIEQNNLAEHWNTRNDILKKVELAVIGVNGESLSSTLNDFWGSWEQLTNFPEDLSVRSDLVRTSERLIHSLKQYYESVNQIRLDISDEIQGAIKEVNLAANRISELNKIIQSLEARKANSNDFRDERDKLVHQISEMIDIDWFENKKNHIHIQIGSGHSLVSGIKSYPMALYEDFKEPGMSGAGIRLGKQVLFDLSKSIKTGKIPELIQVRDEDLKQFVHFLDEFTGSLSFEINRIHSGATGLETKRRSDESAKIFSAIDQKTPLTEVQNGHLEIHSFDNQGNALHTFRLEFIEGLTTPQDLIDQINKAATEQLPEKAKGEQNDPFNNLPLLKAEFTPDGRIQIKGSAKSTFTFGEDTSGILATTGFQSFFHLGKKASDIQINPKILQDTRFVSTGFKGSPGDNRAAMEIFELKEKLLMRGGTATFNQAYDTMIGDIGLKVKESEEKALYYQNARDQYQFLHDSVSGVNLDEELTNMVQYQRAYDASAKYIATVDEMTQTLINMKR